MRVDGATKLITCIVPKGNGIEVLRALKDEKGITAAELNYARGVGRTTALVERGVGETTEKEIINVIVPDEDADTLFEYLYEKAGICRPHGGLMYMHATAFGTAFVLPNVPDEE